jgi:hypothetical protein
MVENYLIQQKEIENRIFTIRGFQVMIDRDLAEMYKVETKVLNQSVKRNIERFPEPFRFQLSEREKDELVTNCDRLGTLKHSSVNPFAFTEQGVAMLSAVLRSSIAVMVSIQIMQAFVEMRRMVLGNVALFQRIGNIEHKQLEADQKFEQIFKALESKDIQPDKGIFYDGQVFDAWKFVSDLVRQAKTSLLLVDNYIDDRVLQLLSKRSKGVTATIYTQYITKQLAVDLQKHNTQYEQIIIKEFTAAHDRFLIIDETELYHIGASIKDLGKKWFAFSKMNAKTPEMLNLLKIKINE